MLDEKRGWLPDLCSDVADLLVTSGSNRLEGRNARTFMDDFSYDLFVSYRQQEPDKSWVRKVLVPGLEQRGLRVLIDYRDFRLGPPLVELMAEAVEQTRYTLAVLTPAYLASNFTNLENVLAEHLGLEKSQNRLVVVLREPCQPRLGLRARLWLDMTDDEELDAGLTRLSRDLKEPADTSHYFSETQPK